MKLRNVHPFQSLKFHCSGSVSCIILCYPVIITSEFCSVTLNVQEFTCLLTSFDERHIRNVRTIITAMDQQSNCASNVHIYWVVHYRQWSFSLSHQKSAFYFLSILSASEPAMTWSLFQLTDLWIFISVNWNILYVQFQWNWYMINSVSSLHMIKTLLMWKYYQ
jgi:hypothetical protein